MLYVQMHPWFRSWLLFVRVLLARASIPVLLHVTGVVRA